MGHRPLGNVTTGYTPEGEFGETFIRVRAAKSSEIYRAYFLDLHDSWWIGYGESLSTQILGFLLAPPVPAIDSEIIGTLDLVPGLALDRQHLSTVLIPDETIPDRDLMSEVISQSKRVIWVT